MEHFARIMFVAEMLGGPTVLPREEVNKLFDSRTRYGVKAKAGAVPGCPVVAEDMTGGEEKFELTRGELVALIDEVLKARGLA
jgi:L-fuculose-phosphate aldolase